jgi:hypothetical protein
MCHVAGLSSRTEATLHASNVKVQGITSGAGAELMPLTMLALKDRTMLANTATVAGFRCNSEEILLSAGRVQPQAAFP